MKLGACLFLFVGFSSFGWAADKFVGMKGLTAWGLDTCGFTGCWKDFDLKGEKGDLYFSVRADTTVHTGGELIISCQDGQEFAVGIPRYVDADYTSNVIANPCRTGAAQVTVQAGLAAQYFDEVSGVLSFWSR